MSIGAIATKDQIVGGERQTDGLWKHRSILDADNLRATGQQTAPTGRGLELLVYLGGPTCYVQGYDRDASQYLDVAITGKNVILQPNGGGQLYLPANCVDTSQIRVNAVQELIGSYTAQPTWSTTAGGWQLTPVQATATPKNASSLIRMEFSVVVSHSVQYAVVYAAIGWDGQPQYGFLCRTMPVSAAQETLVGTFYAGGFGTSAHTWGVWLQMNVGGTMSIPAVSLYSTLYITEQKR